MRYVCLLRGINDFRHAHETVNQPLVAFVFDRDSRLTEFVRVGRAFIAERIKLGGVDGCWHKPLQPLGPQRGRERVFTIRLVAQIMIPEPSHHLRRQEIPSGIRFVRRQIKSVIRHRIQQQLMHERWRPTFLHHQRHSGGEIRARAFTTNRDARRVAVKGRGIQRDPSGRGVAIVQRYRKFVFRREAILDRNGHTAREIGERAT